MRRNGGGTLSLEPLWLLCDDHHPHHPQKAEASVRLSLLYSGDRSTDLYCGSIMLIPEALDLVRNLYRDLYETCTKSRGPFVFTSDSALAVSSVRAPGSLLSPLTNSLCPGTSADVDGPVVCNT